MGLPVDAVELLAGVVKLLVVFDDEAKDDPEQI